jgi:hypothetical protein
LATVRDRNRKDREAVQKIVQDIWKGQPVPPKASPWPFFVSVAVMLSVLLYLLWRWVQ